MGLNTLSSSSYDNKQPCRQPRPVNGNRPPNPNPLNFQILRSEQVGRGLVIEVLYPDCTNYEGRKILVYEDVTAAQLRAQGSLDPHFSDSDAGRSPMARLEPTVKGWDLALQLAELL